MPTRFARFIEMFAVAVLLCGCGRGGGVSESAPAANAAAVTVTDGAGRELSFAVLPERIVSLSPAVTETLYAIGESDRLVGRTRYCLWPEPARSLPVVGGISDPDVETVLSLRPDLVIVSKLSNREIVDQFEGLGIRTLVCAFQTVEDVAREMGMIAGVCGASEAGMAFVESFKETISTPAPSIEPRPRVLLLLGIQGLYSAGRDSYAGRVIELAGGENLAARTGIAWPQVSSESLLEWLPDAIVVAIDHGGEGNGRVQKAVDRWKEAEPWKRLPAVVNDRVLFMNDSIMTIPGPRLTDAVERIQEFLREPASRSTARP